MYYFARYYFEPRNCFSIVVFSQRVIVGIFGSQIMQQPLSVSSYLMDSSGLFKAFA